MIKITSVSRYGHRLSFCSSLNVFLRPIYSLNFEHLSRKTHDPAELKEIELTNKTQTNETLELLKCSIRPNHSELKASEALDKD